MWSLDALKRWLYQRGFLVTKVKQLKVMGTLPGAAIGDHKTRFHFILVRGHDHGKVKYKNVYKSSTFYVWYQMLTRPLSFVFRQYFFLGRVEFVMCRWQYGSFCVRLDVVSQRCSLLRDHFISHWLGCFQRNMSGDKIQRTALVITSRLRT